MRVQAAFLTGQSDPRGCALSPAQGRFLAALGLPAEACLPRNFPYDDESPPHRETGLVEASWNNARQYLAAWRPSFRDRHRGPVLRLLARAERTLLLAGSCGLELLGRLELPAEALARLHVVAYGPFALRPPGCATTVVQGRRDWISRLAGRRPDLLVDCDHLGYLECPEVLDVARRALAGLEG